MAPKKQRAKKRKGVGTPVSPTDVPTKAPDFDGDITKGRRIASPDSPLMRLPREVSGFRTYGENGYADQYFRFETRFTTSCSSLD